MCTVTSQMMKFGCVMMCRRSNGLQARLSEVPALVLLLLLRRRRVRPLSPSPLLLPLPWALLTWECMRPKPI